MKNTKIKLGYALQKARHNLIKKYKYWIQKITDKSQNKLALINAKKQ